MASSSSVSDTLFAADALCFLDAASRSFTLEAGSGGEVSRGAEGVEGVVDERSALGQVGERGPGQSQPKDQPRRRPSQVGTFSLVFIRDGLDGTTSLERPQALKVATLAAVVGLLC